MIQRRPLKFGTEQDVVADVEHLRLTGYEQVGQWSLPRTCWHLSRVIEQTTKPAAPGAVATPEQTARKNDFLALLNSPGGPPTGLAAPAETLPPPHVGLEAVDELIEKVRSIETYPHAASDVGPFGPVPFDEIRQMHLIHAAHHLSFLIPNP